MNLAFDEIDRIEALLSNYRPSSELSRISREAGFRTRRHRSRNLSLPGTLHLLEPPLQRRIRHHRRPSPSRWGFFFHQGRIPSQGELNAVRNKIGWKNIALDPQTRTVSFTNHQTMELDPGSIGKGFAVDSVAKLLRNQGVTSAFISAGGSTLYAIGAIPGTAGWPVDFPTREPHAKSLPPSCSKTPRSLPAHAPRSSSSKTPSLLPHLRSAHHAARRRHVADHRHRPQRHRQ